LQEKHGDRTTSSFKGVVSPRSKFVYLIVITPQKSGSKILFTGMVLVTNGTARE